MTIFVDLDEWCAAIDFFQNSTGFHIPQYSSQTATTEKQCALLGAGATGRVFRLDGIDHNNSCVKIAIEKDCVLELEKEYGLITTHQNKTDAMLGCRDGSFARHQIVHEGVALYVAWFIMDNIGLMFKFREEVNARNLLGMCLSLGALHCVGILHGDARYRNVVVVGDQYRWVDLREMKMCSVQGICSDFNELFKSVKKSVASETLETYARQAYQRENTWNIGEREVAVGALVAALTDC